MERRWRYPLTSTSVLAGLLSACFSAPPSPLPRLIRDLHVAPQSRVVDLERTSGPLALSESEAVARALRRSTELQVAAAEVLVAEGYVSAATQLRNPQFRINNVFSDDFFDEDAVDLALRIYPPFPPRLHAEGKVAKAEHKAQKSAHRAAQGATVYVVKRAYAEAAFAAAESQLVRGQLEVALQRLEMIRRLAQEAHATRIELLRAEVERNQVEEKLGAVRDRQQDAERRLRHLLQLDPSQAMRLRLPEVNPDEALPAPDTRRFEQHPMLVEAAARLEAAQGRAFGERLARLPWFDFLQVEQRMSDNQNEWALDIAIAVPIFSLNNGRIEARDAEVRRQEAVLEHVGSETLARAQNTWQDVQQARAQLQRLQALRAAMESTPDTTVERARRQGRLEPMVALDARHTGIEAELHLLQAARRYHLARLQYGHAMGEVPETP